MAAVNKLLQTMGSLDPGGWREPISTKKSEFPQNFLKLDSASTYHRCTLEADCKMNTIRILSNPGNRNIRAFEIVGNNCTAKATASWGRVQKNGKVWCFAVHYISGRKLGSACVNFFSQVQHFRD